MGAVGKIVEVQGGRIVRSTGRKDRHSKIFTSRGPRDRRVRLAANTAIQFYDLQDRLGYDRPSEAVDWLMEKAKASIDKLIPLAAINTGIIKSTHRTLETGGRDHSGNKQQHAGNIVLETSFKDLHLLIGNSSFNSNPTSDFADASNFEQMDDSPQESKHRMRSKTQDLCHEIQSLDPLVQKACLSYQLTENRLLLPSSSNTMSSFRPEHLIMEKGQFQKIVTFNKKLDSGMEDDLLVCNPSRLLLQQPDFGQNQSYSSIAEFDFSSIQAAIHPRCSMVDRFVKSYAMEWVQDSKEEHNRNSDFISLDCRPDTNLDAHTSNDGSGALLCPEGLKIQERQA